MAYSCITTLMVLIEGAAIWVLVKKLWGKQEAVYTNTDSLLVENLELKKKIKDNADTIAKIKVEIANVQKTTSNATLSELVDMLP